MFEQSQSYSQTPHSILQSYHAKQLRTTNKLYQINRMGWEVPSTGREKEHIKTRSTRQLDLRTGCGIRHGKQTKIINKTDRMSKRKSCSVLHNYSTDCCVTNNTEMSSQTATRQLHNGLKWRSTTSLQSE